MSEVNDSLLPPKPPVAAGDCCPRMRWFLEHDQYDRGRAGLYMERWYTGFFIESALDDLVEGSRLGLVIGMRYKKKRTPIPILYCPWCGAGTQDSYVLKGSTVHGHCGYHPQFGPPVACVYDDAMRTACDETPQSRPDEVIHCPHVCGPTNMRHPHHGDVAS